MMNKKTNAILLSVVFLFCLIPTAAFALGEYELSEPVESQAGYHIILRLPLDPEGKTMEDAHGEMMGVLERARHEPAQSEEN